MKKIFKKFILIDLALYALCFIAIFIESEEVAYMNEQLVLGFSDTYMIVAGIIAVGLVLGIAHLWSEGLVRRQRAIGLECCQCRLEQIGNGLFHAVR